MRRKAKCALKTIPRNPLVSVLWGVLLATASVAAAATGTEPEGARIADPKRFLAWMERSSDAAREEAKGCASFEAAAATLRRRQRASFDVAEALRVLALAPKRNAGRSDLFTALAQELPNGLDAERATVAIQGARGCEWGDGVLLLIGAIREAGKAPARQAEIRDAALEQVRAWTSEPDGLRLQAHAGDVLYALVESGLIAADSRWLMGLSGSRGGIRRMLQKPRRVAAKGGESPRAWLEAAALEARGARDYRLKLSALCVSAIRSVEREGEVR